MENDQILNKRIFKGSFTILFFTFLASPIAYLTRVFYSQTLSVDQYGLFYAVSGLFALLITYNDLGFGYSLSFLVPKFLKEKNYLKCWNLYKYEQIIEIATSTILSIALIIFAKWLSLHYFKSSGAENLIYLFSIYFITNSYLEAIKKFFMGLQEEAYYSSIQCAKQLLTLVFSLFFIFFNIEKTIYYAISWSLATLFISLLYSFLLHKKTAFFTKRLIWDVPLLKLMNKYAIPTLIATSVYSLTLYSDTFFLTLFRGIREVGIYNIVVPLASISALFLSPISRLILPLTSHLMETEEEKVAYLLDVVLKITPFIALYFGLFILLFPSSPVILLFGSKWKGLAEIPLAILAIAYIPAALSNYMSTLLSGFGKVKALLHSAVIISIFAIITNASLIFKFGITGAVIANALTYFLSTIVYGYIIKSTIRFSYPLLFYAKLLFFSLLLFLIVRFFSLYPAGWTQFISYGIVYTIIFLLFGYFLKLFDHHIISLLLRRKDV